MTTKVTPDLPKASRWGLASPRAGDVEGVGRKALPSAHPPRHALLVGHTHVVRNAGLAIVALNVADIITTTVAISRGATEGNPMAALFVSNLPLFVAIKVLFPVAVALRMWSTRHRTTPMLLAAMWWVVGVYSLAIVVNLMHLAAS